MDKVERVGSGDSVDEEAKSGYKHSDTCDCGSRDCNVDNINCRLQRNRQMFRDKQVISSSHSSCYKRQHRHMNQASCLIGSCFTGHEYQTDMSVDIPSSSGLLTTSSESVLSAMSGNVSKLLHRVLPTWRFSDDNSNDKRRHDILCRWLVTLEKGLRGIVGFVKQVPGFSQLPNRDKINLVKRSICESWLVTRHRAFNRDLGCYTAYNGFTFDLVSAVGEQFSSVLFSAAVRMQALRLTDEETFLVKAFVVFFTDGIELEDPVQVEIIQRRLLLALKYLLARSHSDDPLIVARLIGAITELRNVTDSFRRFIDGIIVIDSESVDVGNAEKIPQLFWEVLLQR